MAKIYQNSNKFMNKRKTIDQKNEKVTQALHRRKKRNNHMK